MYIILGILWIISVPLVFWVGINIMGSPYLFLAWTFGTIIHFVLGGIILAELKDESSKGEGN